MGEREEVKARDIHPMKRHHRHILEKEKATREREEEKARDIHPMKRLHRHILEKEKARDIHPMKPHHHRIPEREDQKVKVHIFKAPIAPHLSFMKRVRRKRSLQMTKG